MRLKLCSSYTYHSQISKKADLSKCTSNGVHTVQLNYKVTCKVSHSLATRIHLASSRKGTRNGEAVSIKL